MKGLFELRHGLQPGLLAFSSIESSFSDLMTISKGDLICNHRKYLCSPILNFAASRLGIWTMDCSAYSAFLTAQDSRPDSNLLGHLALELEF